MAKASHAWTPEDMAALSKEIDGLGEQVTRINEIAEAFHGRLEAVEKLAAAIDITEKMLPSEIVAGLSPSQVFATALNASITGMVMAHPTFGSMAENHQVNAIRNAIRVAELTLHEFVKKLPAKKAKS
jgi:hypothetical protein